MTPLLNVRTQKSDNIEPFYLYLMPSLLPYDVDTSTEAGRLAAVI